MVESKPAGHSTKRDDEADHAFNILDVVQERLQGGEDELDVLKDKTQLVEEKILQSGGHDCRRHQEGQLSFNENDEKKNQSVMATDKRKASTAPLVGVGIPAHGEEGKGGATVQVQTVATFQREQTIESFPGAYACRPAVATQNHPHQSGVESETTAQEDLTMVESPPQVSAAGDEENQVQQQQQHHNSNDAHAGLAVANVVNEVAADELPQAENVEGQDAGSLLVRQSLASTEEGLLKEWNRPITLLSLVCVVVMVVVVILLIIKNPAAKDNNNSTPAAPTDTAISPTQAPTSLEAYLLSLLPDDTLSTLLVEEEEPDSESAVTEAATAPQTRAFQWLLEDFSSNSKLSEDRIRQRFSLATLYYSTAGEGWVSNNHWLDHNVDECDWDMKPDFAQTQRMSRIIPGYLRDFFATTTPLLKCNVDGLYQHLWLDHNNLKGTIPEELYMLTSLKTLSLGLNDLRGTISSKIGQLTNLEGYVAKGQKDGGQIPSEIGLLTNLRALLLNMNGHEGSIPSELWQLTNLDTLTINANPLLRGTIPSVIGTFQNLRFCLFHDTSLSGTIPTEIGMATSLEWLAFVQDNIGGSIPTELWNLQRLFLLDISSTHVTGNLPTEIGKLTALNYFTMNDNQLLTSTIPSEVGLMTNLTWTFEMSHNQFLEGTVPTQIGLLTRIRDLSLRNNGLLTGRIPSQISLLTSLERLALENNTMLTGPIPQEMSHLQNNLYGVQLGGNPLLSGTIPVELCALKGDCTRNPHTALHCESKGLTFDCSEKLCGCNCSCPG